MTVPVLRACRAGSAGPFRGKAASDFSLKMSVFCKGAACWAGSRRRVPGAGVFWNLLWLTVARAGPGTSGDVEYSLLSGCAAAALATLLCFPVVAGWCGAETTAALRVGLGGVKITRKKYVVL